MSDRPICIVCKWRRGEQLQNRCCRKCAILTAAEGTREKFGLPKPKQPRMKAAPAFVAAYNKAIREGQTVTDIAIAMGMNWQTLRDQVTLLRDAGYELEKSPTREGQRIVAQPPIPVKPNHTNEHGGGKSGVAGCKCQPCLDVRRKTYSEWKAANPQRVEEYRRRQREKMRRLNEQARRNKPS